MATDEDALRALFAAQPATGAPAHAGFAAHATEIQQERVERKHAQQQMAHASEIQQLKAAMDKQLLLAQIAS